MPLYIAFAGLDLYTRNPGVLGYLANLEDQGVIADVKSGSVRRGEHELHDVDFHFSGDIELFGVLREMSQHIETEEYFAIRARVLNQDSLLGKLPRIQEKYGIDHRLYEIPDF